VSELALTLIRLGFLALLWAFVLVTVLILRRDLTAPAEARPAGRSPREGRAAHAPKPTKVAKQAKVKGTKLVVIEGPLKDTVIPLGTEQITVGRAPDSTLIIDDDYASSRHARIYPAEGSWIVEDLGSTNGTWIDRSRITSPTVLQVGAPLRVGRTTLQIQK
jgi:pSer/pThr/pTyr-binding forkhead associated (FHA) protein